MDGLESFVSELQEETRFAHTCNICQLEFILWRVARTIGRKTLTCVADDNVFKQVRVRHGCCGLETEYGNTLVAVDRAVKMEVHNDQSV